MKKEMIQSTIKFLHDNEGWFKFLRHQMTIFKTYLKIEPKIYIKVDALYKIILFARSQIGIKNININKWNAMDICLSTDGLSSDEYLSKYNTLKKLNQFLSDSIDTGYGLIGVSLKGTNEYREDIHISTISKENRITKNVNLYDVGFGNDAFVKLINIEPQHKLFKITARQFGDELSVIQGEVGIDGSNGKAGKAGLGMFYEISRNMKLKMLNGIDEIDFFRRETYITDNFKIKNHGEYCFSKILERLLNIKSNVTGITLYDEFPNLKELIERKNEWNKYSIKNINSILISQSMLIIFLEDLFNVKSKRYQTELLSQWTDYATSMSNFSAKHYKVD